MRCTRGNTQMYGGGKDDPGSLLLKLDLKRARKREGDADGHRGGGGCSTQPGFVSSFDWLGGFSDLQGRPHTVFSRSCPDFQVRSFQHQYDHASILQTQWTSGLMSILAQRNDEEADDLSIRKRSGWHGQRADMAYRRRFQYRRNGRCFRESFQMRSSARHLKPYEKYRKGPVRTRPHG